MKAVITKPTEATQPPVFPKMPHRLRPNPETVASGSQRQKRDNIFSKSRETREDRGARQIKMSHQSQTFPHGANY
jgi:hypothetical protein